MMHSRVCVKGSIVGISRWISGQQIRVPEGSRGFGLVINSQQEDVGANWWRALQEMEIPSSE